MNQKRIAIIGGGPAGLAAAELLSRCGHAVTVYDAMPTFARKFLLAGKSGLNITHSEDYARFTTRFGAASPVCAPLLMPLPTMISGIGQQGSVLKPSSARPGGFSRR